MYASIYIMTKRKRTKVQCYTKDRVTQTPLKQGLNLGAPEGWAVLAPLVGPVTLLLLQTQWYIMNDERTVLYLRQTEHTRGHLWHKYLNFVYLEKYILVLE